MKAYSLKKAKELIRAYNDTLAVNRAAEAAQMPVADAREILVWLSRHDKDNASDNIALNSPGGRFRVALPLARIWAKFLFVHGISAKTAAAAVNWPVHRLYEKVASAAAWAADKRELPLYDNERRDPDDLEDPAPEELAEIAARLEEVRASRDRAAPPKRVEVIQYDYDPHTGIFE